MLNYEKLTLRNAGYVSAELQERIRDTRLLVAGCGIGSVFAEAAVRLGFERLLLVDGDTVDAHNLNRQDFTAADVGRSKVAALAQRLRAINPAVDILEVSANLGENNTRQIVADADLVFDTVDFLDLSAIVRLHDECQRQGKPAITAIAVGWGAGVLYFPVGGEWSFRRLFRIAEGEAVENGAYVAMFAPLMRRLADRLDPQVHEVVSAALKTMEDGAPCPASQVAPGAFAVGALAMTLVVRILAGLPVNQAPHLLIADLPTALTSPGIDLSR
ncbi:ThiF family adenylyltransferase [uncultured Thiodictyon sp.]|uniref:HesA/MoeB/ThiF family protein n=1 Tax=uncultured Thiodictyon sp. TaxID=1846217 RepID=UPI0025F57D0F|nr:ThiF family adenylyltransferase [uncultured Thiodictyon sp.]